MQAQNAAPNSHPAAKAAVDGVAIDTVTHAPVARARVKLACTSADPLYTWTDAQGAFRFPHLAPVGCLLEVQKPGFLPSSYGVEFTAPRPTDPRDPNPGWGVWGNIRVPTRTRSVEPDGTVRLKIDVPLTPPVVITGKVTDARGVPMTEWLVGTAGRKHTGDADAPWQIGGAGGVGVDEKGEFRLGGLEPGKYFLAARRPWGQTGMGSYRNTFYPSATVEDSARALVLAAGQHVRADIRVVQQAGVRIAGKISAPVGGSAAPGAFRYSYVTLVPENGAPFMEKPPFALGQDQFALENIPPGKYTMYAETYEAPNILPDAVQSIVYGYARDMQVAAGNILDADITLMPLGGVAGVAAFREGCKPVPIRIVVSSPEPFNLGTRTLKGPGQFSSGLLYPGRYYVRVESENGPEVTAESIRLGDRDVLKNGFDAPYAGNAELTIRVGCAPGRVR